MTARVLDTIVQDLVCVCAVELWKSRPFDLAGSGGLSVPIC
jgi:hypothetical protein